MFSFPIKPMLLKSLRDPFNSAEHIFEWKVDGVRCIMFYENGKVRLHSRTGKECTSAFPELWTPPVKAKEAVFDGEVTVFLNGKPDFEAIMERYLAGSKKISELVFKKPVFYFVWDILWLDGKDLTSQTLIDRKGLLDEAIYNSENMQKMEWLDTEGLALWKAIQEQELEGMVCKLKKSNYLIGRRSDAWVKVKNYKDVLVNVLGYSKKDGAVLVGEGERVQGHAIGMRSHDKRIMLSLLDEYGKVQGSSIWLPPGINGRVRFTTWTANGHMRDCHWVEFFSVDSKKPKT